MNILLLGYGKMGKTIEELALKRGHTISGKITEENRDSLDQSMFQNTDVVIEFSSPEAAFDNIMLCLKNGKPVVSGTTGWLNKKPEVEKYIQNNGGAFFYSSNFSIGVNIFFRVNQYLAEIMEHNTDYDVSMKEIHHTEKKDSPSGTAITLAEDILKTISRKSGWEEYSNDSRRLNIEAEREGQVPGTHIIKYENDIDKIEIKHEAKGRKGFATGALLVAEWILEKKGILSMDDYLKF